MGVFSCNIAIESSEVFPHIRVKERKRGRSSSNTQILVKMLNAMAGIKPGIDLQTNMDKISKTQGRLTLIDNIEAKHCSVLFY